jgi:hypothetical protein
MSGLFGQQVHVQHSINPSKDRFQAYPPQNQDGKNLSMRQDLDESDPYFKGIRLWGFENGTPSSSLSRAKFKNCHQK